MNPQTYTATLCAPRERVFNFLANIENLPRWAASFCERIYIERGLWKGLTVQGESSIEMEAWGAKGVIALRAGISPDRLASLPILVLGIGERSTLVGVTFVSSGGRPGGFLQRDPEGVAEDLRRLAHRFGGEVHTSEREPELSAAAPEPEVYSSTHFFI
jgi:hypothetical protein